MGSDEEASIALIAFDEAISSYAWDKGAFHIFAEVVIRRRIIDHYRKITPYNNEIPFSVFADSEDSEEVSFIESITDTNTLMDELPPSIETYERRAELRRYKELLAKFRISMKDLRHEKPKHADSRQRAIEIAGVIAKSPDLLRYLWSRKALPLKELETMVSISRKTLERHRRYIIALVVVMVEDLTFLQEYLGILVKDRAV